MRLFNAAMVDRFMTTAKMEDDVPIESKMVSRSIQSAQGQVEGRNFEIRKNVLKYDDVLNRQRKVIYDERRRVLEGEDLHEQIRHFINDVVGGYVDAETAEGFADDWDLDRLWTALKTLYPVSVTPEEVEEAGGRVADRATACASSITSDAHHAYDAREEQLGARGHARGRAPGRAVRAGPQVARAPLRDGLPPGGHRPAGDGPARPAGRVPARGLPALRGDERVDQGGVGRLPVQRPGRRRPARSSRRPRSSR